MDNLAAIELMVLFNPSEAWPTTEEFTSSLASFYMAHGFDAHIVKTNSNKLIIQLTKNNVMAPTIAPPVSTPVTATLDKFRNSKPQNAIHNFPKFQANSTKIEEFNKYR